MLSGKQGMKEQDNRMERVKKPARCPACKHAPMASILWGYPAFSPDLEKDIEEGRVVLGGCCVSMDDPAWECSRCGQQPMSWSWAALVM